MAAALTLTALVARPRNTKSEISRSLATFNQVYKELQFNYVDTLDPEATMRTAIDAMLKQTDPYTEYYAPEEQEEILSVSSGEYAGIGSIIMKRDSAIILSEPRWDSPARRAGVRHGDIILAINGEPLTPSTDTKTVSSKLKGQPGTEVTIDIKRPHVSDSLLRLTITRGTIKINPVPYYGYIGDGVGYIRLTTFSDKTAGQVRDAVKELMAMPQVKALVLDLRDNGGGVLESAVQIVGDFVPKGTPVVEIRYREKNNHKTYKTTHSPISTDIPLAVLIDGGSASSAEILAGALQDLDRAVIVGERSYGKGLVQNVRPMPYKGLMKVTTGRYYIPSGRLIQAIDYSHRAADGSAKRIPDSLTNIYHTASGREVRDGGGITPDSTIASEDISRLMYKLIGDMWIWDYANRYANTHPATPDPMTWTVDEDIYQDFIKSIDRDRFKYELPYDAGIKYLRDAARLEGYLTDSVGAQIDRLADMLKPDLDRDLLARRDDIIHELDVAIGDRYFSEADQIRRSLRQDSTLTVAKNILNDAALYRSILAPAAKDKSNKVKGTHTGNAKNKSRAKNKKTQSDK